MAETKRGNQVSTTVSPEVFEALEDHRWTVRKKMTAVVAEAVQDYIVKHNIVVEASESATDNAVEANEGATEEA